MQGDDVPLEELVGLVAGQEKLEERLIDDDRVASCKVLGIPEVFILRPGQFA
jgi:hypothetical protein